MNQVRCVAGLDRPDVQLTFTSSPIWYRGRPPLILGPCSGSTEIFSTKNLNINAIQIQMRTSKLRIFFIYDYFAFFRFIFFFVVRWYAIVVE